MEDAAFTTSAQARVCSSARCVFRPGGRWRAQPLSILPYYRISLGAGETVSIDMLPTAGFFLEVMDANDQLLSNPSSVVSSSVTNVTYTNGTMPRDVYIRVTSGPYDFKTNNQYTLSPSYH